MKKFLFYFVQWTWGIIQNLLGLILFLFLAGRNHRVFHGALITTWKLGSSLSLGMFIFTARPYDLKLIQQTHSSVINPRTYLVICDWLTKSYLVWMF